MRAVPLLRRPGFHCALLALVQVGVALLFLRDRTPGTEAAWTGLPLDDAWIHLVYARALVRGEGLAYNPGQLEAGFTSPLWALLLAPVVAVTKVLGVSVVAGVKVLGVAIGWATSALTYRLAWRLVRRTDAALIAGLWVALDPSLGFAQLSGMEVGLAAATVLAALVAFAEQRHGWAAVALGLAGWARPENALFVAMALPLVTLAVQRRSGWRKAARVPLPTVIAALLWVGFCLHVTGRPLPNTFYAKHAQAGLAALGSNLAAIVGPVREGSPWFVLGSGVVLLIVGAAVLVRGGRARALRLLVVAHPATFLLGVAWAHRLDDPTAFYWNRYVQPALPFLLLLVAIGTTTAVRALVQAWRERDRARLALAGLGTIAVLLSVIALPATLRARAALYAGNCQNIEEMQVALGRWVAEHTAPGEWVGANDAGAIRYVSDRPVVDLTGLNHHEVLFGHRAEVLARAAPRYEIVFPAWYPALMREGRPVVHRVRAERYTICNCDQEELVVLGREVALEVP